MSKFVSNWTELSKLRPNARYRIVIDKNEEGEIIGAWIRPTKQYYSQVKDQIASKHNLYLGRRIFDSENRKWATEMLHKFGFRDVEITSKGRRK